MSYSYRGYSRQRKRRRQRGLLLSILLLLTAVGAGAYALGRPGLDRLPLPAALRGEERVAAVLTPSATTTSEAEAAPTASAVPELPTPAATAPADGTAVPTEAAPVASPTQATAAAPTQAASPAPTQAAVAAQNTAVPTPAPRKPTTAVPKATATAQPKPTVQAGQQRYYIVGEGDTLFGIASERKVSVQQLAIANGLTLQSEVYVGQQLLLPTRRAPVGIKLPPRKQQLGTPKTQPMAQYSPELVSYLEGREGTASAAIYVPSTDTLYTYNPRERYLMASTVKVPIMLTQLSQEFAEDRRAAGPGTDLLTPMIVVSDNNAATSLFSEVGGKTAIDRELRARGIRETRIEAESWGLSTTTAPDMALLMRSLYYGQRLNADLRQLAVGLLGGIVQEQRWGVPTGLGENTYVAFKGGWLPDDVSWQVHQVGIAEVQGQPLIFAFYTSGQPDEMYGRQTLQGAAEALAR